MGNNYHKLRKSKKGVSDIIGNILILGITVTLFSSIMYFVVSMPQPQEGAYADFTPDVTYLGDPVTSIELNLTHKGGQELKAYNTNIYLDVNDTRIVLHMADSLNPLGDLWTVGETFIYRYPVLINTNPYMLRLSVMISDTEKNTLLFNANIVGGTTQTSSAPIIGARGTTPSPTFVGASFSFYAQVIDTDSDLNRNSVFIDLTSIGLGPNHQMSDGNYDGIFTCGPFTALQAWNGAIAVVNASDWTNHPVSGRITMSILTTQGGGSGGTNYYGPFVNYSSYLINGTYPPDASGGESGGTGTTFYYIRQFNSPYTITNIFSANERVLIEVWSDSLRNLAIENSLYLVDARTGAYLTPPTSINAFGYGGIFGTFHKYVVNFTAPGTSGAYPLTIRMRDNIGAVVSISDGINVNNVLYPKIETYKVSPSTGNLVKTGNFNHTDTVYLKIVTKDTDSTLENVYMTDIEVSDYSGRYIIKKLPPTVTAYPAAPSYSAPLSSLFKTSAGAGSPDRIPDDRFDGVYTLKIVPMDAYQGWWLPGKNAYTMILAEFADTGITGTSEDYHSLSVQFNITAPLSTTDIVTSIGSGSFTWSSSGATWSSNSLAWFAGGERSDQWSKTIIDDNTLSGPVGLELADVDGDSYKDLIVGWQDPTWSVGWYKNLKVDGSEWSTVPYLIAPAFDAMAPTNQVVDHSTDHGNVNEDGTVYLSQDRWPETRGFQSDYIGNKELSGSLAFGTFGFGTGTMGVVVSMVHPVVYTTGANGGTYQDSYGILFNRGIYIYWYSDWGASGPGGTGVKYALEGTTDWISGTGENGANGNNNPGAMDVQVADMDNDGFDDVVAVYQDGTTRVWLNQWSKLTGDANYRQAHAFAQNSLIDNLPTVPGRSPWDDPAGQNGRAPKLRLVDMNKDGYPDIIRTSTVGQGTGGVDANVYVLYTKQSTMNNTQFPISEVHVYGTATGTISDLYAIDNRFENITESMATIGDTGLPVELKLRALDASPSNPRPTFPYFDTGVYAVPKGGNTMTVNGFTLNAANSGKTVASAALNLRYIVWPAPASNTRNPTSETITYGTKTGTISDLTAVDNRFENLTEAKKSADASVAGDPSKGSLDTTGSTIGNILTSNSVYYNVPKATTMHLTPFAIDAAQASKLVSTAALSIKYYTNGYTNGNYLQWSLDGTTWNNILQPSSAFTSSSQYTGTFDLKAVGVDTYAELNSLRVMFINGNSGSGTRSVYFDVLVENILFVDAQVLDWKWTIPNDSTYPFHDLTVNGYCYDGSESFSLAYSVDNTNWVTLQTISATVGQDYTFSLNYHTGSSYYIRVVDLNQASSDQTPSRLCVNAIWIVQNNGLSQYAGTETVKVSFDGITWIDTGVLPSASDTTWKTAALDLAALKGSAVTYADLQNLRVSFRNNDMSGGTNDRTVWFDVVNIQATFYEEMRADWTWTINNDVTYPFHNLTVNGYCYDGSESFTVMYSTDNSNWVTLDVISQTTAKSYSWSLPKQTGAFYYVRIVDDDRTVSDLTPSTICVNMIKLVHYPADISWAEADKKVITISGIGSSEYITALAVGDIGKSWGDYKADSYPDIVVSTSKVGNLDDTHTLFVILQSSGSGVFETPRSVTTSLLASKVGNNNAIYDTTGVELGDFNGDSNLDIVLVTGFAPGRTGSGVPSLYIYINRPDLGSLSAPVVFQEGIVNALDTSQSAINVQTGFVDLSILLPFLGIMGVIACEAAIRRKRRR